VYEDIVHEGVLREDHLTDEEVKYLTGAGTMSLKASSEKSPD
jgi:hypothetical protein